MKDIMDYVRCVYYAQDFANKMQSVYVLKTAGSGGGTYEARAIKDFEKIAEFMGYTVEKKGK